ncbi:MAG: NupC/NupG family nucleoside CNT transporter [Flavobacteriales bacterium]|nr:MAG: NupC/NupG family nucleoside CNT transporter [Flavobacteriales bacterium]
MQFIGFIGILGIFGLAFALSNNRKAINYRTIGVGLFIQVLLAVCILKTPIGKTVFGFLGKGVQKLLTFSDKGAEFIFGPLANDSKMQELFGQNFIFFFRVMPTIIFIAVLVKIFYHLGILQSIIKQIAKAMHFLMRVSGSEALSNISSAFVGQVEAQLMIGPYVKGMTKSELLASMTGSMACIAGGVMATYIQMGIDASSLLAASIMAAPGALVISKIVWPETEISETAGTVKFEVKKENANLLDAIAQGASEGLGVALNVVAMLLGFLALIYLFDFVLGSIGGLWGFKLSLENILGTVFSGFAFIMGVPTQDIHAVGGLMGTKLVVNEFVGYLHLKEIRDTLQPISVVIATFALCGFANFSSIAIQVGGIGKIAPTRRKDLAKLGFKALLCGTLANYLSATIAGLLTLF